MGAFSQLAPFWLVEPGAGARFQRRSARFLFLFGHNFATVIADLGIPSPLVGKKLDHQVYLQQIQWGDDSWVAIGVCFPFLGQETSHHLIYPLVVVFGGDLAPNSSNSQPETARERHTQINSTPGPRWDALRREGGHDCSCFFQPSKHLRYF